MLITIFSFILTISILVFVHEYGHYCCARFCKVGVKEFSIGFGKELYSITDKIGTRWKICLIPLGGYVRMQEASDTEDRSNYITQNSAHNFDTQPMLSKILIVLGGPIANFIFAMILFAICYNFYGKYRMAPLVSQVMENSPAQKSGIIKNDLIVQAAGIKVNDFFSLKQIISIYPEQQIELVIKRGERFIKLPVTPQAQIYNNKHGKFVVGILGIYPYSQPEHIKFGIFESITESCKDMLRISKLTLVSITQIFKGSRSISELRGNITIAQQSKESIQQGGLVFMIFVASMSLNLGLINLLPIPVLDGGRFCSLLCESILGRTFNLTIQNIATKIGILIIIFLVVISTSNDIKSLLLSNF